VTDTQPASHVPIAIALDAKASSLKIDQKCGSEFGALLWPHLMLQRKNCNTGAQLQSLTQVHKCQKIFWKIYFLCDVWCTQICSFQAISALFLSNNSVTCDANHMKF